MKPIVSIDVDAATTESVPLDRLVSMTVTDQAGMEADQLEITFDDRDQAIAPPVHGVVLRPAIGFGSAVALGSFAVDGVSARGGPRILTVRAKPVDMGKRMKEPKTRSWTAITFREIVETIALEHGLKPAVAAEIGSHSWPHLSQTGESDLNLLTRLAGYFDAVAKPASGFLVLAPKGEGKTVIGVALPTVAVTADMLSDDWEWDSQDRSEYGSVLAWYRDYKSGERQSLIVGEGTPRLELRHTYSDSSAARRAALGKLNGINRGKSTLSGSLAIGDATLAAEGRIDVTGLRPEADGLWSLTSVTHEYSDGGFITRFEAETPGEAL